jgi:S-adenosylhomocysteine hydrolase
MKLDPGFSALAQTYASARAIVEPCVCGLQHIVPSQEQLFTALRERKIVTAAPVIFGKLYSTVPIALPPHAYSAHELDELVYPRGSFERSFQNALHDLCDLRRILPQASNGAPVIILDDGGFVSEYLVKHYTEAGSPTVVVEQTTSGLRRASCLPCPVVAVAGSIVKREIESLFVAEGMVRCLAPHGIIPRRGATWGVAGFGAVGRALATLVREKGVRVLVHEFDERARTAATTAGFAAMTDGETFACESDVILGCTGADFTAGLRRGAIRRKKPRLICASCGSSDTEFSSWIAHAGQARIDHVDGRVHGNAFDDVDGDFQLGAYRVLAGGFPVNLNRLPDSDPPEFLLTRMLLFAGVIEALPLFCSAPRHANSIHRLSREAESRVLSAWLETNPYRLSPKIVARARSQLACAA